MSKQIKEIITFNKYNRICKHYAIDKDHNCSNSELFDKYIKNLLNDQEKNLVKNFGYKLYPSIEINKQMIKYILEINTN
jgi:hypothetical protein